jgi:uncharacterized protein
MPFLDVPITRGKTVRRRVPVGELADGSPVALPVVTIAGAKDGPTVFMQAGIHGDELTGVEICRTALHDLDPARLRGTVVCVPLANVPAYLTRTRGFLTEERWLIDINRIFPGNPRGLLTERIANVLFEQFVRHADLTIDLHSALDGCDIAPFTYVDPDDDAGGTLAIREKTAVAFGTPYVYYKKRGAVFGTSDLSRSISAQADGIGRAVIVAEMGESRRVSTKLVPIGVRGVRNVLRTLGMLEGNVEPAVSQRRFTAFKILHAEHGGGLRLSVDIGTEVTAGQDIGEIVDVFGDTVERLVAPSAGFVLRIMRLGSVATGAEVVWIAN